MVGALFAAGIGGFGALSALAALVAATTLSRGSPALPEVAAAALVTGLLAYLCVSWGLGLLAYVVARQLTSQQAWGYRSAVMAVWVVGALSAVAVGVPAMYFTAPYALCVAAGVTVWRVRRARSLSSMG